MRRRLDIRFGAQQLVDARHGAGGLLRVAPGLVEVCHPTAGEDGQQRELHQGPRGHAMRQDILRPQPQNQKDAPHDQQDEQGGHQRTCRHAPDRFLVGRLDALVEPALGKALAHKGLHGFQRVHGLAGKADGAGEGILGVARRLADLTAEDDQGHDDEGKAAGDHQGQLGADDRHDGQPGDQGDQVAQRD